MSTIQIISIISILSLLGFESNAFSTNYVISQHYNSKYQQSSPLQMGFFDDLQLIFSEEGKKNRRAYEERQREEQEEALRQMMERRRNPEKMAEYNRETTERRSKLQKEREVWEFQNEVTSSDPMEKWNDLRAKGEIKVGSDLERDASSSRLGSEGLVEVRVDERMPYIDQGYVDEDADVIGNLVNIFGGKNKEEKQK